MSVVSSDLQLWLEGVDVRYGDVKAVSGAAFGLHKGEIGCLLGPSGCGKSTLLRAIAGFETVAGGSIAMAGKVISSPTLQLDAQERNIGMVFQDIALFPHLTVEQNIAFGLNRWPTSDQQARVQVLLDLIGLSGFETRYPNSLSGGQQQRVALARALAPKPAVLLMDEPFSGLDATLKETLVPDVRDILLKEGITALVVTHDQQEAFSIADKVALMNQGCIEQFSTPYEIYHKPETRFAADFIGQGYFIPATVLNSRQINTDLGVLDLPQESGFTPEFTVDLLVRPDDVLHDDDSPFEGEITKKFFKGTFFQYQVALANGRRLWCIASSHHNHEVGQRIGIRLDLDHFVLFPC
ncbi:ABC transporter ATP-binding protein [Reinekea blandensis]|uniref:ABC transporter related protein n=1 Tax=Reinekea blandensis MED297 TaxID=314283 RepID=A4BFH3_9GAMM|nr:ABC transporter ATP-binding protein [Reinekea blandensis]EAR09068.1 ABC transporter related protein [Reinekea sp. MED297] [Reinekea blandensis MED297]